MMQVDRRVLRTKKNLENALITLSLEKDYNEITIQEITERADIAYRTFFRHYSDKDELLNSALDAIVQELREITVRPSPEVFTNPAVAAGDFMDSAALFRHVQEHGDLYRVLLHSDQKIVDQLITFAADALTENMRSLPPLGIPIEVITNHAVSATFALIRWWLDTDMETSPDVMGEYSARLIAQPVRELVLQSLSK